MANILSKEKREIVIRAKPAISRNLRRVCAAAGGACFVAITQLATHDRLTESQLVAIGCFAATLPVFAAVVGVPKLQKQDENSFLGWCIGHFIGNAFALFGAGLMALLYSFGWIFSFLFACPSVMLFFVIRTWPETKPDS